MQRNQVLVLWIVWFAFLQVAFAYHFILDGGLPSGENIAEPMNPTFWALCLAPILAATVIRWIVLPKLPDFQPKLVAQIVGMALAESAILFEIFLIGSDYPQNQIAILVVALFALFQFAPTHAKADWGDGK